MPWFYAVGAGAFGLAELTAESSRAELLGLIAVLAGLPVKKTAKTFPPSAQKTYSTTSTEKNSPFKKASIGLSGIQAKVLRFVISVSDLCALSKIV
jgi:hypothetical protein